MDRDKKVFALQIIIFILSLGMIITLLVFWNVYLVLDYDKLKGLIGVHYEDSRRWYVLAVGCVFFTFIIVMMSLYFSNLVRTKKFTQMQIDFINRATHELKLPLANIKLFSQTLMQRDIEKNMIHEFAGHIHSESEYLLSLVEHLLEARRLEKKGIKPEFEDIDFGQYITSILDKWEYPVELKVYESPEVRIDPEMFMLVVRNLLSNAFKYGGEKKPEVTVRAKKNWAILEVRDYGEGIPEKYLKHLFNRFFRVPQKSKEYKKGTGLGLFIVKNIMRQHKGKVSVRLNENTKGVTFVVSLPMLRE